MDLISLVSGFLCQIHVRQLNNQENHVKQTSTYEYSTDCSVQRAKMLSIHTHQPPFFLVYDSLLMYEIYIQVFEANDKGFEYRFFDLGPDPFIKPKSGIIFFIFYRSTPPPPQKNTHARTHN